MAIDTPKENYDVVLPRLAAELGEMGEKALQYNPGMFGYVQPITQCKKGEMCCLNSELKIKEPHYFTCSPRCMF